MNCYRSPAKSTKIMHPQNRYWQNYEMPDVRNTIDFWEKDAENDNCRKNLRRGYNFHENSTDKKISEYSEMNKRFTRNDEDTAQRSKFSKNFSGIRPFDEFAESYQTEERIATPFNYKPLGRDRGNLNSRGRGVGNNPRQGFQLNWNTTYKRFRKPPVDRETDGERDDFTAYLRTNQKARGISPSEPYKREFNENSLVNTIYGNRDGNRKRHFTSQGIYPYKFKNTRSNSRTPERYKSRSRSQSQSRYRRSRERSSSRYYTSRSPSSSRSRSSSRRGGYRSPSQRDAKHYSRSYDRGQTHSPVSSRSYEHKSESYRRKSRGSFRERNYRSRSSSYSRSPSSSRNSRSSSRGHHYSNRGYHRSRGYSRSYSRDSSRESRYSFRSRSQNSSRDRRYRSRSYRSRSRSRSRSREYRLQSLSRSRSRSGSRRRYRSESSETSGSYRSQSPPKRIAGSPKRNSDYELQSYLEEQWNDETIRSRNGSPSYSSVENRKLRRRDSVDSLSSIMSTESNYSSSRSRSRSSEKNRNWKPGKRDGKYTPQPSKNKNKSDMSGKFRNPSRNEAIVRRQFERYEEENEEKMLASVDDLLGKLVGSVTEHSHFELVNEPIIPQDTTSREHECRAQETEYRTIQVKPKSPKKLQQMSEKSSTHEGSSHSSSKAQETLQISVTSNEERNVICEKETEIIETCSARKRKHLSEDVNNRNTQDLSPSVKKCKKNISQLMTEQKIVAESGLSNQLPVHTSTTSLKTSEDTTKNQDPKQDGGVKVAQGESATLVPSLFTEMPKKPNSQVATNKLNDQKLAEHEMEAKFKRNAIMPKNLIKSPKRKEFANQESVEQSIELSINISKQQLSPLFSKTVSIKSKCEKNMNSPNGSEMQTEKVQTKESEKTAEGSPESSIKPVRKDSSDLDLASFDEFTDSEQDSGSKSSSETENINSQDRIQQKLMKPQSDFTNVDVIQEYNEEMSVSETEKSVIKSHKELSSQNSFEVDYDGIVKTSTPIRNVLDNVSNKNTVQECSGEVVKKNLFEAISKESDGKEKSETQQKENIELMSKESAKCATKIVNQTDHNLKEKCHQKISNEKRPNSDRNSQVAKSLKVGKAIHTNRTDTIQKKCNASIKQAKGVNLKESERNTLKEQPKPKMKSITKDKEKKTLKEKYTQSSDRKASEDAKKLKYKLKDVSSDIKLPQKKTDISKEQKSGEFSEENNISNDSMQSTCDETLPKLVSRKDKRRDSSTTSIESSDKETSILTSKKHITTKERINPKQKPYKQNEMLSSKSDKEDKPIERKHVGSRKLETGTSKTEKMRPHSQTASKIKLIEQEDLFMPSTPHKTKHTTSKKDKVNKPSSQIRRDGPKKFSAAKTMVKGPINKVSNSLSINEKPKTTTMCTSEETIQSETSDPGPRSTTDVSSSSEMETDGVVAFTQDAMKNGEKDNIAKTISTEKEVDGNSTSGEEIDVAKSSLSRARRQSRAISKEHLKVLEKNKEVRNRTCLELKQGQIGGRKMSKSEKIQKLKHKAHAEILRGNPLMKPATKTIQDKEKEERRMMLHASAQKTNQPGTAEFKKPISGIKHNETDIIAKNILQKVPGKIEIYDANFKKVTYDSKKTTSDARANESLKSTNDTDEAQTTDVSLQEYRNLHEDLDLSSDEEQLQIDLDKPKSNTEKTSCEKDKHNQDKQEEIKDMQKRSENEKGKMEEKEESIEDNRENMQEKQEQTPDVKSNEDLIHDEQCETTKKTSRLQNPVAESKENEAGQSESDKNKVKSTLEETPKESKPSEEKMLSSDSSMNLMDSVLLSPANPTATIPEDQVDFSDIRIMYYDHGVPQSPYIAEEDVINAKTLGKIQNQEEIIPSSRPETPNLNISPRKDQTARKILPEEDFPMLSTAVSPVEENLASAQNSQETEASSDYGTDSNRGTPLSVTSEPSEEVEHQNPLNRRKSFSSKEETVLSGPEKLNAIDILEKQSDNPHLQKFLSELRQESSNYHQTICFTHRKSFKNLITANGDDNLTVGFLELQKLREPKLQCIKCNVCKMYFDPCRFLLHFDVKNVELDETKSLLTEPMHAMPKMDPNVQRIWDKFITLKNVLVNATLSFSLDSEKDQLDRYNRPSDAQGINQTQSLISPVLPSMMSPPTNNRELSQTNTNQTSSSNTDSLLSFIGTNLVFVQRQLAVQVAATITPVLPVYVNAVPQNPNLSQQSQNFTSPTNPATKASMASYRQVDRRKSLESGSQNLNMMATGARNTRSLSDKGMETQNYTQNHQTRLRHQSSTLSEQQSIKNAQLSATMPTNSMLVRDYQMVGVPGQNSQMITPQQGLMNPCKYQTTQQMNSRDPLNACQTEANTLRSMFVPQTQPPPYPGTSVNHQSSRYNALPNHSRQNCMLQKQHQQQPAASQVQQSAMNHSQQQILSNVHIGPVPPAHQQNMPVNRQDFPATMIPAAHQNMFVSKQQSSMNNQGTLNMHPNRNSLIANPQPSIPSTVNQAQPMFLTAYLNMPANQASSSMMAQSHANLPSTQAPLSVINPAHQNMGYRNGAYMVPPVHQPVSTTVWSNQYQQPTMQSVVSAQNSLKPNHLQPTSGTSSLQSNSGTSQQLGNDQIMHSVRPSTNFHQSSNVQSCSSNQTSISRQPHIDQHPVNQTTPAAQTRSGESALLPRVTVIESIQAGNQFNHVHIADRNVPSFNPNSINSNITNPTSSNSSLGNPNQRLRDLDNVNIPKRDAVEVVTGNEVTKAETQSANNESQRTSGNLLSTATDVAQTIQTPADAQRRMVSSCVNMVASIMWMYDELKQKTADVVSAQQELQQVKDEMKKTVDEYHTTEGVMTQKIQEVLSRMTN